MDIESATPQPRRRRDWLLYIDRGVDGFDPLAICEDESTALALAAKVDRLTVRDLPVVSSIADARLIYFAEVGPGGQVSYEGVTLPIRNYEVRPGGRPYPPGHRDDFAWAESDVSAADTVARARAHMGRRDGGVP